MCQPNPHRSKKGTVSSSIPMQLYHGHSLRSDSKEDKMELVKPLKVLLCSENVPPQVNGIARRIGMYKEGLTNVGCIVDSIHPDVGLDKCLSHVNPWNFTSRMMILNPLHLFRLLGSSYDVVHVVMPSNLSSMWILAAFKLLRCIKHESKPALIVSWHCNIVDYIEHFTILPLQFICHFFFYLLFGMLPLISDRILTPTRRSEPRLVNLWKRSNGKVCSGVCFTGVNKTEFSPCAKYSSWGQKWASSKESYLSKMGKKHLLVCVGRLSPEKSVDDLITALTSLNDCALWLVGDGPQRSELERLARDLDAPVKFLGYQSGEALHAVYTVADLFVCPSLTETFGQTVNEALASQVRVALPNVPVFNEAYGDALPKDAFWKPHSQAAMIEAIKKQLHRHSLNDPIGQPNLALLKTWDEAVHALFDEYLEAFEDRQHTFTVLAALYFPLWCAITFWIASTFFVFSQLRSYCGGSVRLFFKKSAKKSAEDALIKVQSMQRMSSFDVQNQAEKSLKSPAKQT